MLHLNKLGLVFANYYFVFNIFFASGFNIDTSYPIIIKNSADGISSHFGYTVTLINEKEPGVIVGSPRSNSTLPAHSQIVEPGVIWQCSFERSSNICRVVVMDPTGNVNDPQHPDVTDRKDGGWLGGAMTDDANNFIACGSRWSNQYSSATTEYHMNGICYWRPKQDIFRVPLPPVSPISRILTITDSVNQHKNIWVTGQAGFSVHSPSNSQEVLLGAPGVQSWKGSVIRLSKDTNGNQFGNVHVFNDELTTLNLQNDSYFGFAINSGNFFKNDGHNSAIHNKVQYVAGAPRGKGLKGQVIVFQIPLVTSADILAELQGTQIGSYFGSAVCVADLNKPGSGYANTVLIDADGFDDLLVGAPLHSVEYKTPRGSKSNFRLADGNGNGDEGVVFVYLSNKGMNFQTPTRINGALSWSHFGTAIVNLGDINNDGFDDVAVGAPYGNSGSGVVYIYHGASAGISREKPQEIEGKSLDGWIKGFGYSLSSRKDIDLNGYNDLAIGAYDSGHIVVLRSRPIISVFGKIRSTEKKLLFNATTFEIESCIQYTGRAVPEKIDFRVKIMIDLQSFPRRVFLKFPEQSNPTSEHEYLEEAFAGQESCTKFTAVVTKGLETTGKPIEIKQTVISIADNVTTGAPTFYEIIRFGGQVNTRVSGPGYSKFCKSCPLVDSSTSKIKELVLPLAVPCGDDDVCISDLLIGVSFLEISLDESFIIGSSPVLTMEVKIDNLREPAIAPVVTVLWNSKTLKKTPPECQSPWSNDSFTEVKCPLGKTIDQGKYKTISLEFDVGDIDAGSLNELWIQIEVSTASEVADVDTMSKTVRIPLVSLADIFMEGSKSSSKFNLETLSLKTHFLHTYEVGLDGPTPIVGATVNFQIPTSVEHVSSRKTKFEIAEPVTSSKTTITCYPESGVFASFTRVAISRSMENDTPAEAVDSETDDQDLNETVDIEYPDLMLSNNSDASNIKLGGSLWRKSGGELTIECNSSQVAVKCMSVMCRFTGITPGTKFTVAFPIRVESSNLKNFFKRSKFSSIKYISSGAAEILGVGRHNIQPDSHKPDTALSVSIVEEEIAKPVSHLIYALGVFLGFFILALIVYCMYRSGVFNRKKAKVTNETESDPLQKNESKGNGNDPMESGNEDE